MQEARERGRRRLGGAAAAAAGLLAAALWLREPSVRYLVACAAATAAALLLLVALPRERRRWAAAVALSLVSFAVAGGLAQRAIHRVDHEWSSHGPALAADGVNALHGELEALARSLAGAAERALDAPDDPAGAFGHLARLTSGPEERGVVLYRDASPAAWSGRIRVPTDTLVRPLGVSATPFYTAMHAVAQRGKARAVATALVRAQPPADSLAATLASRVANRAHLRGFDLRVPRGPSDPSAMVFAPDGRPLLEIRPIPLAREEMRLRVIQRARLIGTILLAIAVVGFITTVWRGSRRLAMRTAALGVGLACVALVPLSALSNATRLFDPAIYFAPLGGPLTASAGALGLTSGLLLLGMLALLRSRLRVPRWAALVAVVVIAAAGPFLLRDLAKGITPPAWGVATGLWLGWQVTMFLAAAVILLAGAWAGREAVGGGRGVSPFVGPLLAAAAALVGPAVWNEPQHWPPWYPLPWILAIAALALTRRTRGIVFAVAAVAAFGATTLVWGATIRKRVELAEIDIQGLQTVDPYSTTLLERFLAELRDAPPPTSRAELLTRYMASDLSAAGFPVQLTAWAPSGAPLAELLMAQFGDEPLGVAPVVSAAQHGGTPVMLERPGVPGAQLLGAAPHPDGGVTAVVVEPRTRLIPHDPFAALLGLARDAAAPAPYTVTLADVGRMGSDDGRRWTRQGNELHGGWVIQTAEGPKRAHVEIELRSLDALVQRGTLILLLDFAVLGALWILSTLPGGGFRRWLRARRRRWARSYRARLSLVLFAFFVIPAIAFAAWSYRQLREDDRRSRELLVRETLRAATSGTGGEAVQTASERVGTPLFLYREGALEQASDTLYSLLAPVGRFLPPAVHLDLGLSDEVTASTLERLGAASQLFGYRASVGRLGQRIILAAPAPTNEAGLDQRRNDLGILVLFSTALGALAALWLSGIAARQFARPIGALRHAALAIAAGEREPPLAAVDPPSEFVPVFSAFRRMASDLAQSRTALEDAQRRTAAVLRNVASGVVAVNEEGVITLANPRAEALLGAPLLPGAALAASSRELAAQVEAFLGSAAPEEEFDAELAGRQLHGRLTRLGRGGAVLTLDDVTELARAQRVLAWGEMARQVAHEIKNPLTPIRLGVQHLRRARADARVDFDKVLDQNVTRILAEIDRLDEIARAFSKYGSAPAERPLAEPTDVAAVARDVVQLETMGESGLQWSICGAEAPAWANARGDELREVLLNVLENARLAGARAVNVNLGREDGRVLIDVVDDGQGIPASVLPRIFEPHFSTRTSGSGLGLAISRRIIESWGGTIGVQSEEGRGAHVRIELAAI